MYQTFPNPRRRHGSARRLLAAPVLGLLAAAVMMLLPASAGADTSSSLTVVGTSDVSDSGLVPNRIQPAFQAAYPQFTFKYIGSATGTAINNAKSGTGGPSVLIVHAASLENQFVAGGYSYKNQYGNALFTNDFVLAGSTPDPAGVRANAPNNVAQAFADVAARGVAGHATFLTRGGNTTASGTTVEEHALWALMNSSHLTPTGVSLCTVSAADGGGMSPISPSSLNAGGNCPDNGTVDGTQSGDLPSWYIINPVSQAASVTAANACTVSGAVANSCYVLTDRGTFDYLTSGGTAAGGPNTISNLSIVTRDNSATAPGGANQLINYFHAYIINPAVSGETVNLTAAQDFVNFITSPTIQSGLSGYLNHTTDPGGAPFKADASPAITASGLPTTLTAGQQATVTGTVTNQEPGFPALAGKPVSVDAVIGGLDFPVATGTTNATGGYSITFAPPASGSYEVTTGAISQIENAALTPAYGDILSPGSSTPTTLALGGTASIAKATASTGSVQVSGTVGPAGPLDGKGKVTLLARKASSKGAFNAIGGQSVHFGQSAFAANGSLKSGAWTVEVQYADPGSFNTVTSATKQVTVPLRINKVSFKKLLVRRGVLTLSGTLGEAPTSTSATVKLFAVSLGKIPAKTARSKTASTALLRVAAKRAPLRQVAKTTVKVGRKTYTIKHRFKRGYRYALQLEYVHKGQPSTHSGFTDLNVK